MSSVDSRLSDVAARCFGSVHSASTLSGPLHEENNTPPDWAPVQAVGDGSANSSVMGGFVDPEELAEMFPRGEGYFRLRHAAGKFDTDLHPKGTCNPLIPIVIIALPERPISVASGSAVVASARADTGWIGRQLLAWQVLGTSCDVDLQEPSLREFHDTGHVHCTVFWH
ncbi:hypothetical protein B0T16DRAFT_390390 [Cercophora newfieldiana]|uniref:Uncharacterized protein n=1 Tax=Cercophora newfieldiana TaxID=92897 RepID=A0AA39Y6N2_9PEZI|nr:hypothetical protein B0T16DRAFT_390390 [Cercophora newfieldiana]